MRPKLSRLTHAYSVPGIEYTAKSWHVGAASRAYPHNKLALTLASVGIEYMIVCEPFVPPPVDKSLSAAPVWSPLPPPLQRCVKECQRRQIKKGVHAISGFVL